jgi:hypothetical protein
MALTVVEGARSWQCQPTARSLKGRRRVVSSRRTSVAGRLARLSGLAETRQRTDLVEEKSDVIHAVNERVTVKGPNVVRVKLTPMAERTGLPALLPENVPTEWAVARPTGVGRGITTYCMPIEGRDEWVAAARRLA